MSNEEYLQKIRNYHEDLRNDPKKLKAFLRRVMGPPHKTLEGKEREQIILLLNMIEPYDQTNNQHSWTDYYKIGDVEYHATYFPGDKNSPIIDKMLPEEDDEE